MFFCLWRLYMMSTEHSDLVIVFIYIIITIQLFYSYHNNNTTFLLGLLRAAFAWVGSYWVVGGDN